MSLLFDTLQYTKQAIAAGFTQQQAEFQAEKMAELVSDTLVTKSYFKTEITALEKGLKHDIEMVEKCLKHEIGMVRKDITHSLDQKLNKMTWTILGALPIICGVLTTVIGFAFKATGKA